MQELLVILLVLGAVAFLGNKTYKSLFAKKPACGGSCGCDRNTSSPALDLWKKKKSLQ